MIGRTGQWAYVCVAVGALFIGGCASGATAQGMTVEPGQVASSPPSKMAKTVLVDDVVGGSKTSAFDSSKIDNAEFKAALVGSLRTAGFFADGAPARYAIVATLVTLSQPTEGIDMTVTSTIRYKVTETSSKTVVLEEEIVAPYTAHLGDAFVGSTRLRLATEGSARKSIASLIQKMSAKAAANPGPRLSSNTL